MLLSHHRAIQATTRSSAACLPISCQAWLRLSPWLRPREPPPNSLPDDMTKEVISSLSNPLVKRVRSLRQRKARAETGLFVVEGLHPVGEALDAGWEFDSILYAPEVLSSDFGRRLVADNPSALQPVSSEVMQSLADKDNPQGVLGVVRQ